MTFKNVLLYILIKYLVFYLFRMIKMNDYRFLKINELTTPGDWFYYLWLILFLPAVSMLLFAIPIYYSFRIRNIFLYLLTILSIFVAEYFVYVYWTSDKHIDMNGIVNGIIGILLFILFFFRNIILAFNGVRR